MPYANKSDKADNRRLVRNDRFRLRNRIGESVRIFTRGDRFWEEGTIVAVTPDYVEVKQNATIKYDNDGLQISLTEITKVMLHPKHQPKQQFTKAEKDYLKEYDRVAG